MSSEPILADVVTSCPQCGAELVSRANYCWLCGAKRADSLPRERVVVSEVVNPPPTTTTESSSLWVAVAVMTAVGWGAISSNSMGLITLFLIGAVPALIVVLLGSRSARQRGQPWSAGKAATVAATTAATSIASAVGIAMLITAISALLMLAAVIALFLTCVAAAGGNHP